MCLTKAKFPVYLHLLYQVIVSHISYFNFPCSTRPILKLGIIQLTMCLLLLLLVCRSVSKSEKFLVLYILYVLKCNISVFWLCHPFVEWYVCAVWCIVVAWCVYGGSCLDTDKVYCSLFQYLSLTDSKQFVLTEPNVQVYGVGDEINMYEIQSRCRMHGRMRNSYTHALVGI